MSTKLMKSNPLAMRLEAVKNLTVDNDTLEALKITPTTKPRQTVEHLLIQQHEIFLNSFEKVFVEMNEMEKSIKEMDADLSFIKSTLEQAKEKTTKVVDITNELKEASSDTLLKQSIIKEFLEIFTITKRTEINQEFFENLKRLQQINVHSQALLIGNQNIGMEILTNLNTVQEEQYEMLFKWTQLQCRTLKQEQPEISSEFTEAMRAFRFRPILFDACIDEISSIRQSALVRAFQNALSVGTQYSKPIEYYAHDPTRYVGDILAWIHQACIAEYEMLSSVFGIVGNSQRQAVELPQVFEQVEGYQTSREQVLSVLDKNTEGLAPMLNKRIDAMITVLLGSIQIYKIQNTIQFYHQTLSKILDPKSTLLTSLESLETQKGDLTRTTIEPSESLDPPPTVKETMSQIKEIFTSLEMNMVSSNESILADVKEQLLYPLITNCESPNDLTPLDQAIFKVNIYHYINNVLTLFGFCEELINEINTKTSHQLNTMLDKSGLLELIVKMKSSEKPYSLVPELSTSVISTKLAKLDNYLVNVTMDVSETLYRIKSLDIAKECVKKGCIQFVKEYSWLVSEILDPANKYEFPNSLIRRNVKEVETLLSLD
ncbi:Golgi transport complex subunit 6 [Boothiomyces macroporosus]|uniref:Conserved oligomeric Golgi complex subunit 6 n=1 Tax=Boothiomyces macroporosus TaxID=261099 RepID=A0AAD5Y198_9FUNG|nr:Golgi transport complex subunit 6 [Boothiomyces macroporosus]